MDSATYFDHSLFNSQQSLFSDADQNPHSNFENNKQHFSQSQPAYPIKIRTNKKIDAQQEINLIITTRQNQNSLNNSAQNFTNNLAISETQLAQKEEQKQSIYEKPYPHQNSSKIKSFKQLRIQSKKKTQGSVNNNNDFEKFWGEHMQENQISTSQTSNCDSHHMELQQQSNFKQQAVLDRFKNHPSNFYSQTLIGIENLHIKQRYHDRFPKSK
eukprot:403347404